MISRHLRALKEPILRRYLVDSILPLDNIICLFDNTRSLHFTPRRV